ncbi:fibronectin type III domain-containing protein, partial [bacterium]|nr:fibronectin type III domain-containing protein [bacterium]
GGGSIRVLENFEIGGGRVCVSPYGTRVDGWFSIAIIQGSLYLLVTPDHAEGSIEGSVTIPPGDYWLFTLDEPINLGHFMLMLGYYWVPQSDFWGSGIWSTCNSNHCEGIKYGVRYSHEIFGQLLCIAMDQNQNFYAWIDLDLWGAMQVSADGLTFEGDLILTEQVQIIGDSASVPIIIPSGMNRSLFTLGYQGTEQPVFKLQTPDGAIIDPLSADDKTIFYSDRDGGSFYSIRNPESGTWFFLVDGVEKLESWQVQLLQGNQAPQITIDSVEIIGQRAKIQWAGNDKDGIADVGLFFDTDNMHADGAPIALSMNSGQEEQLTHWDLCGIPSGTYYLYAKIDDGRNPPVVSYYNQPIHIVDSIPPQAPGNLCGNAGLNTVHLWWESSIDRDLHSYQVRFNILESKEITMIETSSNEMTIGNLQNGIPYRFIVVSKDFSGNWSRQSRELILVPDVSGDLTAPDQVQSVQARNQQNVSITVDWAASKSPDTDHYLVYYGTLPGLYGGTGADQGNSPIKVMAKETEIVLTGLNTATRYYFCIQAIDAYMNRAILSAETYSAMISDADEDVDGLPDDWEVLFWGSLKHTATGDNDGDGSTNSQEYLLGTNPGRMDTDFDRVSDSEDQGPLVSLDLDFDGIADDWEIYYQVEDATADNDGDNLNNLQEYRFGTNPFNRDSDDDGIGDGDEAFFGSDPTDPDDPNPRCQSTGVLLSMPSHLFRPGDECSLDAVICNSFQIPIPEARFFAVLDAYGECFFAPHWTKELDYWSFGIQPGPRNIQIIQSFTWPQGIGTGSGLQFIGALTNPDITAIFGEYSFWEFGWTE